MQKMAKVVDFSDAVNLFVRVDVTVDCKLKLDADFKNLRQQSVVSIFFLSCTCD